MIADTSHRPWPPPARPWAMFMRWHDLLFMHWPLPPQVLRPWIPAGLELDTFEGQAWIAVTPFHMSGVRPRGAPALPWLSRFAELNVRTYVTAGGKPGVWFFSLDAERLLAVYGARLTYYLMYFTARMSVRAEGDVIRYRSRRTHHGAPAAAFAGRYWPVGELFNPRRGTLEHFLTERYCLYSADKYGRIFRGEIHHAPWPLQRAEAEVELNTMIRPLGLVLPAEAPLLHMARRLAMVAWWPESVGSRQ